MSGQDPTSRERYDRAADSVAAVVIRQYSTSFGLAARLLEPTARQHIRNVYALVRVADEVVDGAAAQSGLGLGEVRQVLDALESETETAMRSAYSANLVVHAFARTARAVAFGSELTRPFFDSMRSDIEGTEHTQESFEKYVFGSAEVVGLMCLRAFMVGSSYSPEEGAVLASGARRLAAAFQKVNFLRDLSDDFDALGRSYFPDVRVEKFTEADKVRILDDIDADLAAAGVSIPLLPPGSRRAVALAHALFAELAERLRVVPAERLISERVRVPDRVKLRIAARVSLGGRRVQAP